ncbi:MAG: aminoacyl-tRNA hydrolase [Clostridia bacterium]|nr:aminoacyl-tRNA hydrolase [Clostridia bacterium]
MFDLFHLIEKKKEPAEVLPVSALVVGLGNPGKEYMKNRHNAGFLCAEYLAMRLGVEFNKVKFKSVYADVTKNGKRFLIMKPQTYMNHSGEAVREAAAFYKLSPEQIIVISDDASLDVGKQRVKRKGSDGGQKGLRSIIYHMNTDAIPRVKIGVGKKPHPDYDMADWVLGDIPEKEWKTFEESLARSADAVELMLTGNIDRAMNLYNG